MTKKKPLWPEIKQFSSSKYKLATILIIVGLMGLVLPVIPGILLLAVALFILKPEWFEKLRSRVGL